MENLSSIVGQLKKERDRVQQQLVGIECCARCVCRSLQQPRQQVRAGPEEKATPDERQGAGRDPPRPKSPMGKGQGRQEVVVRWRFPAHIAWTHETPGLHMSRLDRQLARPPTTSTAPC